VFSNAVCNLRRALTIALSLALAARAAHLRAGGGSGGARGGAVGWRQVLGAALLLGGVLALELQAARHGALARERRKA